MINAYHQPTRLEEALDLIAQGGVPVAGATGLYSGKGRQDGTFVDVTRLGLDEIAVESGKVLLGASVPLQKLACAGQIPGMEGAVLRRAARAVPTHPMRNMITLGGNIAHQVFWADMPVVLLALEASLEVRKAGGAATQVSFADALKSKVWDGGLITRVVVPLRQGTWGFGYERFSRTANDYSFATACAIVRRDGAVARAVRLVLGALQPKPLRASGAEAMLEGQSFGEELLQKAAQKVRDEVQVAPNFRASPEYRRELAGTLARRALNTAFTWAMREN